MNLSKFRVEHNTSESSYYSEDSKEFNIQSAIDKYVQPFIEDKNKIPG